MITVLVVTDSDKHFSSAVDEYSKRLWKTVSIKRIPPSKNKEENVIIREETQKLVTCLNSFSDAFIVWLEVGWSSLTTGQFTQLLEEKGMKYKHILFVVGGAYWYDRDSLSTHIDLKLSLGAFTMPHWLAFLVLLEQLYRSAQIKKGSSYHHDS